VARIFSEDAWKSDKISKIVPSSWRPEYAWLYSIALADGTFEADAHKVWVSAYACVRPDWTCAKVEKLLKEFERVGLLRFATDENGKLWAEWIGSGKFLPTPERCKTNRYKTGRSDIFSDGAATAQRQLGVGVGSGIGLGLGKEEEQDGRPPLSSSLSQEEKQTMASTAKRFAERLVKVWQEVWGPSAVLRFPELSKNEWEFLVKNHDQNLLEDAFRLFAKDANGRDQWSLGKFISKAAEYMQRVQPIAAMEDREKKKEEKFQALLTEQIAENQKQWAPKTQTNTESVEDFLKEECK